MKERSNFNIIIRLILFVVLIAAGAAAFSIAFMQLTKQKTGISIIDEYPSEDAKRYGLDFELYYDLQGSNTEIKELKKALSELYSTRLTYLYKLTDPENEYENMKNIATINNNAGTAVSVDETLYNMLKSAYSITESDEAYNVFAGAFYKYFTQIVYSDDPLSDDPLVCKENRALISSVLETEKTFAPELVFDDTSKTITLMIPDGYKTNEYTEGMQVLDLNYLRNAFIVNDLKEVLNEKGYGNGFILTRDGITAALSSFDTGKFVLNSKEGVVNSAAITPGSSAFTMNLFDMENNSAGEYEIADTEGHTYFRTPNILYTELGITNRITALVALDTNGDTVKCKLSAMTFNTDLAGGKDLKETADNIEKAYGVTLLYNE